MTMYVFNTETQEIIAVINADGNEACERLASEHGYEQDDLGWTYSEFGLVITQETETINA